MGYVWDEEKTKEVIDEEGWVHSGDLGRIDEDGFYYVAGRMKEVLITGFFLICPEVIKLPLPFF